MASCSWGTICSLMLANARMASHSSAVSVSFMFFDLNFNLASVLPSWLVSRSSGTTIHLIAYHTDKLGIPGRSTSDYARVFSFWEFCDNRKICDNGLL